MRCGASSTLTIGNSSLVGRVAPRRSQWPGTISGVGNYRRGGPPPSPQPHGSCACLSILTMPVSQRRRKSEADLAISATNGRIVALDNLSAVPPWLSDAICRLSTGCTFARRRGQSDHEQENVHRRSAPSLLTGLEISLRGADLADRTINIGLDAIPANKRKAR